MTTTSETLTVSLVFDSNGDVDTDATELAFSDQLSRYLSDVSGESDRIAEGVDTLLANNNGVAITMPTIASLVASSMGTPAKMHPLVSKRILAYLSSNSQGKLLNKETGEVERPDSLFVIQKGPGAGCLRRQDVKEKPAKPAKK